MQRRSFLVAMLAIGCHRSTPKGGVAQRVVSMSASTTEALFAIGAGKQVVGRSRYCDYPPEAQALPSIGGYVDPNLEAILALRPELVVGARGPLGPGIVKTFEDHGIATWFPETESFEQILVMIEGLGERTGHDGRAITSAMRARRAAMEKALAGQPRPKVLLLFEKKPISVAGPQSFCDEMLVLAGGENALKQGQRYATIDLEKVERLDPDVLLDAEMGAAPMPLDSTWNDVRAVKTGRVVRIKDEAVLRPGPRVLDGVATLARALHPGITLP
ncbi:MAG: ABC transporter substrate-binding protein [Polyangiales bacterium]